MSSSEVCSSPRRLPPGCATGALIHYEAINTPTRDELFTAVVFKTPQELAAGSPLYLDMTLWRVVLADRGGMLESFLGGLSDRMHALGSRRVPFKGGVFWDYKPDFKPGDVVEL